MRNKKKRLFQAGLLFLCNVMAMACAGEVIVVGIWSENHLAAAVPALMLFLLVVWQPWLLLWLLLWVPMWLVPDFFGRYFPSLSIEFSEVTDTLWFMSLGATVAAPMASIPLTLAVYRRLFRQGKLEWLHGLWLRFSPQRRMASAGVFLLLVTLVWYAGYKDVPVQHRDIPRDAAWHWQYDEPARNFSFTDSRYYRNNYAGYLWRVRVPAAQMPVLIKTLSVDHVPTQTLPTEFWQQPPIWWQPPVNHTGESYSTGDLSEKARNSGNGFMAAFYDTQTEMLYLWGKDSAE